MSPTTAPLPLLGVQAGFRRFSVAEYNRLTEIGVLTEDDNLELIEGLLVLKMPRNPPHDGTLQRLIRHLNHLLPDGWEARGQMGLILADSVPEPDLAVVRIDPFDYTQRHPTPADLGLVAEVSDSTLDGDRLDKGRIYARAGIAVYWLVNIPDRQVEVYTDPVGGRSPCYRARADHKLGDEVAFSLEGALRGKVAVAALLS